MEPENKHEIFDDMLSKAVGSEKTSFDFEQWKQDHPDEIAGYKKQTSHKTQTLIKLAGILTSAAAVLFLAVLLITAETENDAQPIEYQAKILSAKISLPADTPTISRLNRIFKNKNLDAIDKFCKRAVKTAGPRPEKMTAQQLLEEMETDSTETKGNDHEKRSYNNTDNIGNTV